jgi:hypothetical protein
LSEARQQLIRRFAAASVLAEEMEARLANGAQIDINEHATLSSTLVRLASRIGIDRIARNITPTLNEYLQQQEIEWSLPSEGANFDHRRDGRQGFARRRAW